jgi:pimeloyl-ACP methyl ester carboxylesterase
MMTWYLHTAPRLAGHHRVVLFDLRGHGKSDRTPSGYDLDTMSRDLAWVLDQLAVGPAVLVGHSYGALVALRFASLRPDRVTKLALVEAPLADATDTDSFLARTPAQMLEALPAGLRDAVTTGRRRARFLEAMRFFAEESSVLEDMKLALPQARQCLPTIRCPVLAVYGTQSSCRASGGRIAAEIKQSTTIELPGGHFLPVESPQELGGIIEDFIDG